MRLLMLGWEFPPFISGGLGTACHGLVMAMERLDTEILFVLPMAIQNDGLGLSSRQGSRLVFKAVPSQIGSPYRQRTVSAVTSQTWSYGLRLAGAGAIGGYEGDLTSRIWDYARRVDRLTRGEQFDLIHAHDWMTFPAGTALADRSGKPFVVQVHATEFDRSGENVNPAICAVEHRGLRRATRVIAVSHLTKRTIVERYGVSPEKIRVIHNGIERQNRSVMASRISGKEKVVLFLGRITMQKGPEYFVRAAAGVLAKRDDVRFIMAGWGDMAPRVVEQVAAMGLGRKIHFAGFLQGEDVGRAYGMADVYVLPSVSEPFGLTALEAIQYGVPVILSKTSGVAEVLPTGALKCDFWDTQEMANKILAVLDHPELAAHLRRQALREIQPLTWDAAARKCLEVYREVIGRPERARLTGS